jgi:hypothetical protein
MQTEGRRRREGQLRSRFFSTGARAIGCGIAALALVMMCLWWDGVAFAGGDANEPVCPAQTEASPGFRTYLPDCRAYEMVTPPYKAGGPVRHLTVFQLMSGDGSRLIGASYGGFAETENDEENVFPLVQAAVYGFERTASGWVTEALAPPASQFSHSRFVAASADLGRTLWGVSSQPGPTKELLTSSAYTLAIRERGAEGKGRFVAVGPLDPPPGTQENFSFDGASPDLSRLLFTVTSGEGQVWPGDATLSGSPSLYEYSGVGSQEPTLVGVKNTGPLNGEPHVNEGAELVSDCGTELGGGKRGSMYNAISADGSVVYFTALHGSCTTPPVDEVYARIGASRTIPISEARSEECTGACAVAEPRAGVYQGASEDGAKVFFTTEQPLLNSDRDHTNDLYEAVLGEAGVTHLSLISKGDATDGSPGAGAGVIGVARVSADGSHVYFAAKGVLTATNNNYGAKAEAGGYNLYVVDTATGSTTFIATLVTTAEIASEVQAHCAGEQEGFFREQCELRAVGEVEEIDAARAGVSREDGRAIDTTTGGRFFVFLSSRDLTGAEDTSSVNQVFEYDAVSNVLSRVSVGQKSAASPQGYNNNGNTTDVEDAAHIPFPRYTESYPAGTVSALSVADDGTVFFTSRNALTPQAATGSGRNVYEYRAGNVYLISAAGDPGLELATFGDASDITEPGEESGRLLGVNHAGSEVALAATSSLVPQDTDTQADWYVARVGGGFGTEAASPSCASEACRGALGSSPSLPAAGSDTQAAGENLTQLPTSPRGAVKPTTRAAKLGRALEACRRKAGRKRHRCEALARRRYGIKAHSRHHSRRG